MDNNRSPSPAREPQPRVCRRQHEPISRPKMHPDAQARALAIWRFDHDLLDYPSQELH